MDPYSRQSFLRPQKADSRNAQCVKPLTMRTSFAPLALIFTLAAASKNVKRGLAFADGANPSDIERANTSSSVISWQYDWGSSPPDYLANSGIEYIPMQWGASGIETFANNVRALGSKTILGFNEPDNPGQSNLNATYAAQLWKEYIQPLSASGVRLGTPAVTNAATGIPWLKNFMNACVGCTFDFVPVHWSGVDIGLFDYYMWEIHSEFINWPLWVTEFVDTSTNDTQVEDFLTKSTSFLDSLTWIERYSWFAYSREDNVTHYNLLDTNGNLNSLGTMYVGG